jgi:hypothetical protein
MTVIITRTYKCAPEGHTTLTFKEGDEVTGTVADMALADKAGKKKQKKTPKPQYTKPATPDDEG